jgi:hypothetical protein
MKNIYVLDTPARRPTRAAGASPHASRASVRRERVRCSKVRCERLRRYVGVEADSQ